MMLSYRLLTNDQRLDWLARGGTLHDETTELPLNLKENTGETYAKIAK